LFTFAGKRSPFSSYKRKKQQESDQDNNDNDNDNDKHYCIIMAHFKNKFNFKVIPMISHADGAIPSIRAVSFGVFFMTLPLTTGRICKQWTNACKQCTDEKERFTDNGPITIHILVEFY